MMLHPLLAFALAAAAPQPGAGRPPVNAGERGLWIGPIHLCRDNVENAEIGTGESGHSTLVITVAPPVQPLLQRETAARVGAALPIRLDGRTIIEPLVREPIVGPVLHLPVPGEHAEELRAAALAPCGAASPGAGQRG